MQPKIKIDGEYLTLSAAVKRYGELDLIYKSTNNAIQVRLPDGTYIGNLKYDYAAQTVSE